MQALKAKSCTGILLRSGLSALWSKKLIPATSVAVATVATSQERSRLYGTATASRQPEKSVFISQSADIYTNLALEDWLYRNSDFEKHRVLLLWRNNPCVVIGRHQNPWSEVDVAGAEEIHIPVVRRNSGGGTVYHDKGNLNCTFFSPRNEYDRKCNLEIICRALKRQFGIRAEISSRHDVTLHGDKISGTAAKLGKNAYHHCTVLVDADLKKISALLNPNTKGLDCRATKSIKSPVANLKRSHPTVSVEKVLSSIGYEFLRTDPSGNDGGEEMIEKQRGFQMINPTNDWFPGLDDIRAEYKDWKWNFGKTPDFALSRAYPLVLGDDITSVQLKLTISKAIIRAATLELPTDKAPLVDMTTVADLSAFVIAIKDRPYNESIFNTFEGLLEKRNELVSPPQLIRRSSYNL